MSETHKAKPTTRLVRSFAFNETSLVFSKIKSLRIRVNIIELRNQESRHAKVFILPDLINFSCIKHKKLGEGNALLELCGCSQNQSALDIIFGSFGQWVYSLGLSESSLVFSLDDCQTENACRSVPSFFQSIAFLNSNS